MPEENKKFAKPILLIKPNSISKEDIQRMNDDGFICAVECSNPEDARFIDPPLLSSASEQASAALSLMRYISLNNTSYSSSDLCKMFVKIFLEEKKPEEVKKIKK